MIFLIIVKTMAPEHILSMNVGQTKVSSINKNLKTFFVIKEESLIILVRLVLVSFSVSLVGWAIVFLVAKIWELVKN